MKSHPIIFNDAMVRAILAGRKTQTRRLKGCENWQPGDMLWVREAWRVGAWDEHTGRVAIDYRADNFARREWLEPTPDDDGETFNRLWQQSTDDAIKVHGDRDSYAWEPGQSPCRWRPSIHMPRWASRITLTITGVRQERMHDITEAGALAEGAEICQPQRWLQLPTRRWGFRLLWESIYGPESWIGNPIVWVISFEVVAP